MASDKVIFWIVLFYCPLDGIMTYYFGGGPGKFLMRLRVASPNGDRLPFIACVKRSICVFLFGEGLAIESITAIAIIFSMVIYFWKKITIWDRIANSVVVSA